MGTCRYYYHTDGTKSPRPGADNTSNAAENNRRMAGNAMNALQDMHTEAYRLLATDKEVSNARDALEDVMWYSRTGRADIDFEGGIGALTKEQQRAFVEGLAEKTRSRDDNVKKAKQLLRKIKPDAGEAERQEERPRTAEQEAEYRADIFAEQMRRRYGR